MPPIKDDDEWLEEEPTPAPFMVEEPRTPEARQARLEWVVNDIWKDTKRIKRYMPRLMTKKMCETQRSKDHPGLERIAKWVVLGGAAIGVCVAAWRFILITEKNEALAAEFRTQLETKNGKNHPVLVPSFIPVQSVDAAAVPTKPRKKIK